MRRIKAPITTFAGALDKHEGWLLCLACADFDEPLGRFAGEVGSRCGRCGRLLKMAESATDHGFDLHARVSSKEEDPPSSEGFRKVSGYWSSALRRLVTVPED